jgi:16S rRNA processing protein RimM
MLLVVGEIVRPHGLRGEVVVNLRTDEPAQRFAPGSVLSTDPGRVRSRVETASDAAAGSGTKPRGQRWQTPSTLTVEQARPFQGRMIVEFEGIGDRDVAEELRGVVLCVDSATVARSDDPDEFGDHQLVGLTAVDADGAPLGEVVNVDHAPAADLLILRRPDGRTAMVPFVKAIVPEVDLAGGRVVVTPPEGLFDL